MKKLLLIAAVAAMSMSASAQDTYTLEKLWEVNPVELGLVTNDCRQGFGMDGQFYINCKTADAETVYVINRGGMSEVNYPGGKNCGITRDEAGNIVVSNASFPGAWTEATIKVINPETGETVEYTVPEECGLAGRCDFIGFAKGNMMEDGQMYLTGGNTGTDPFTAGVALFTVAGGEVDVDNCYLASAEPEVSTQTSTVINYYQDLNGEDALIHAYRSGAPSKLTWDGDNFAKEAVALPALNEQPKGACNGIFPFVWDGKELFIYPVMPNYQDGWAIAENGAEEPLVGFDATAGANPNGFQANWLNAEVDEDGVVIYQYMPGLCLRVFRLTKDFPEPTAVNDVEATKTVASVKYFNMAGQEMSEANGVCIAVTNYTDGTTSTAKVVR